MKLRQKIILLIVPIIVLPLMVSGWVSYSQLKSTTVEKSVAQMRTLLEQYALYLDSLIRSTELDARSISNNVLLQRYMVTQSEEERYETLQPLLLKQLKSYQMANPAYYEIRVVFPDGYEDLRQISRPIDNVTRNEVDNPLIKGLLMKHDAVISSIQVNPDNGEHVLYVAAALNYKDRSVDTVMSEPKHRGYLVITVDVSEVVRQMSLSKLGASGFIFTASRDGEAELLPERISGLNLDISLTPEQLLALDVNQVVNSAVGELDLSGVPTLETSFLGEQGYMKGVLIREDIALITWLPGYEITEKTQNLGLLVSTITLVAVVLAVLLLFGSLNHFVLRPIRNLRNEAINIGRGVLTTSIVSGTDDEVGDLALSFEEMRKNIFRYQDHLERLVDERTREVRQALDEAEKSSQAKTNFLSRMSHELRTPLNAILGFSQLYEYDRNLTEDQRNNAREINDAGEHLLSLVNEVLDLSKIEAGSLDLKLESVHLLSVIETCYRLTGDLARNHNITVELGRELCGDIYVRADYVRLKQVLLNLISNAIKYNQEHGQVSIYCEQGDDDRVCIAVKDTGPGIPEDKMHLLFEPFKRLGAEYIDTEGTGIGLLITRQLVGLMGGKLNVVSQPGMGSTFMVELVAAKARESAKSVGNEAELRQDKLLSTASADSIRILVAEDNRTNREVLRQQLKQLGYQADIVSSGGEALECWASSDYHLVLTDIHMPDMDGFSLAKAIFSTSRYANKGIPVIAITADAMEGQAQRCLDAGMHDFIAKPVHMWELQRVLSKWLPQSNSSIPHDHQPPVPELVPEQAKDVDEVVEQGPIDRTILVYMVGDNPTRHRRLLEVFVESAPETIAGIGAALKSKNTEDLLACAHKLKSSSRNVGAIALSEKSRVLETAAMNQQWSDIELLVPVIDDLFEKVERYVDTDM